MDLGINLSGAAYGAFPTDAEVAYFAAKGFTTIRLPLQWEQLQPSLNGPLDAALLGQIHAFVADAEAHGMKVILDIHNYGIYDNHLVGSAAVPISAFADLWGRLAGSFAADPNVVFGLMNEPQVASASAWLPAVNAAIGAIRAAGAVSQEVLVPGVYWDGGDSWTTTDNASVLGAPGAIVDPSHHYAFELHQYLDDTSGQHSWVVSETIGVERLQAATAWARAAGAKLYLGEFGVADNPTALTALSNMLAFVQQNADVWEGGSYWAAGQGWHDYMYGVEPNLGILDMPQMAVLQSFAGSHVVSTALAGGGVKLDTFVAGYAGPSIEDILDANGHLVSRTLFGPDGHATRSVVVEANGRLDLSIYAGAAPPTVEVYTPAYDIVSRAIVNPDGTKTITYFGADQWHVARTETYTSAGILSEAVEGMPDGSIVVTGYAGGHVAKIETYDAAWHFVSRATYDASGHLSNVQSVDGAGVNTIAQYNSAGTQLSVVYTYNAAWQPISTATYDATGHIASVQTNLSNGGHRTDTYGSLSSTTPVKVEIYDSGWHLLSTQINTVAAPAAPTTPTPPVTPPVTVAPPVTVTPPVTVAPIVAVAPVSQSAASIDVSVQTQHDPSAPFSLQAAVTAATPVVDSSPALPNATTSHADASASAPTHAADPVHASDLGAIAPQTAAAAASILPVGAPDDARHVPSAESGPTAPASAVPALPTSAAHADAPSAAADHARPSAPVVATAALTSVDPAAATTSAVQSPSAEHVNPVYRFYDTATNDHFYTTSADEKNVIQKTLSSYHFEGVFWAAPDKAADTIDVFRFYDTATKDHFFTTSASERDYIIKTLSSYHYEGVAFQAYAEPTHEGGLTLERFYNTETHVHHYSASAGETAEILAGKAGTGWVDEGHGFNVHAAADWML